MIAARIDHIWSCSYQPNYETVNILETHNSMHQIKLDFNFCFSNNLQPSFIVGSKLLFVFVYNG